MVYDPSRVTTIVFDWGGVFCNAAEPFASTALQSILGMNPDQITAQITDLYEDHYRGKYITEEFWRKVMQYFNLQESDEINPQALSQAYLDSYQLYPEMLKTAKKLKEKYTVGLLSNLSPVMRDHIRKMYNTQEVFNPEIYSCNLDVGAIKPELEIYQIFLNKAGKRAEECLFIDDSQKNIDAAAILGFQTLLFSNREQFARDITPLL